MKQHTDNAGRDSSEHEQPQQSQLSGLTPDRAGEQLHETTPVDHEHGGERGDVQRHLDKHAGRPYARYHLEHAQVSRARHREKLSKALHETEENSLPESHATFPATSAIRPTTMATLRRVLTRSTLPSSIHVATTSTAICASSAIRK